MLASRITIPKLQRSLDLPYAFALRRSGAIYKVVPTIVVWSEWSLLIEARPKSQSLTFPFVSRRTFPGLPLQLVRDKAKKRESSNELTYLHVAMHDTLTM
jgi:hypothetical protein